MTVTKILPKTQGRDFNFFKKITVTWNAFGGGSSDGYGCDIVIPFATQGVMILNEDAASVVEVSFNGNVLHDELDPTLPSKGLTYDNRVISPIWFRLKSGATATISVRAWAIR